MLDLFLFERKRYLLLLGQLRREQTMALINGGRDLDIALGYLWRLVALDQAAS